MCVADLDGFNEKINQTYEGLVAVSTIAKGNLHVTLCMSLNDRGLKQGTGVSCSFCAMWMSSQNYLETKHWLTWILSLSSIGFSHSRLWPVYVDGSWPLNRKGGDF